MTPLRRFTLSVAFLVAACSTTASPTLPVPPPVALASAPDMDGIVTITGSGAEPDALVFAFNERLNDGVIGTANDSGNFELRLQGASGDNITVWQMVGASTSSLVEALVP